MDILYGWATKAYVDDDSAGFMIAEGGPRPLRLLRKSMSWLLSVLQPPVFYSFELRALKSDPMRGPAKRREAEQIG